MSNTVILGAGIIGVSTAYYLAEHQLGSTIHLVDASPELFASASGLAGGFIARDWFSSDVAELGALSFDEHRRLAEENDGAGTWGYSRSTPLSLLRSRRAHVGAAPGPSRSVNADSGDAPKWLWRNEGDHVEVMGENGTTAQVDPLQLCRYLLQKCLDGGVKLHQHAKAVDVQVDTRNEVSSIRIADTQSSTETELPCTNLIITAGAWSPRVFETVFPRSSISLPVRSLAGHSLIVQSPRWSDSDEGQGCHSIFTSGRDYSPEIFSRRGGHIYIAGVNSSTELLPELATDAKNNLSQTSIQQLRQTARELLGQGKMDEDDLEVVREGLCFRPVTDGGNPILSRIPDECLGEDVGTRPAPEGGVYLASGHGPWGISLSLGTGKVMAEMVQGRPQSADVSGLSLRR